MKKFYFSFVAMLLSLCFSAQAGTVTIHAEQPELIKLYLGSSDYSPEAEFTDGVYTGDFTDFQQFYMVALDGYVFDTVKAIDSIYGDISDSLYGGMDKKFFYYYPEGSSDWYDNGDVEIWLSVAKLDELRTATCIVNVDNAQVVQLKMENDSPTLVDGVNEIKFIPELEDYFTFVNIDNRPFASITLNGVPQEMDYWGSSYSFKVKDGDVVDIVANYPEGEGHISITLTDDYTKENGLLGMTVNGEDYEYDGPFVLPYGDKFSLILNPYEVMYTEFKVNGEDIDTEDLYYYTVNPVIQDYDIVITATAYPLIKFTLNVDNAERVKAFYYTKDFTYFDLKDGENQLSVSSNVEEIYIAPANNQSQITSISIDGIALNIQDPTRQVYISTENISEGCVIDVTSDELVYEYNLVTYHSAGNWDGAAMYDENTYDWNPYIYLIGYYDYDPKYDIVGWNGEHRFTIGVYTQDYSMPYVYLNNEPLESMYDDTMRVTDVVFQNWDVLKMYYTEPTLVDVTFTNADGKLHEVTADKLPAVRDAEDVAEMSAVHFQALTDTEITFAVEPGSIVIINGVQADDNAEGYYELIAGVEDIEVVVTDNSSIAAIVAGNVKNNVVYNLQGVAVLNNASAENISTLRPGIYVLNGKKFIVK